MSGYVVYIVDTETTNLDTVAGDVVEISMSRVCFDDPNFEPTQRTWYLKALNPKAISDEALQVNGHLREDILHLTKAGKEKYLEPSVVVPEIEMWMMEDEVSSVDRIFAGQNPMFDVVALQELWKKVNSFDTFPFALEKNNRIVDIKQIVTFFDICAGKRRRYYNQGSFVKAFGVKKEKAHRADADVRAAQEILSKLMTPVKINVAEFMKETYLDEESV